ncbi:MAG: chemotaxis protein CheW [Vampirovibrionia bacterium]
MNLDQYLGIFIDESRENLQYLNDYLLELEADFNNINILHDIFRVIHTLKGMSGSMGYENMQTLSHSMENVLDKMRNKEIKPDSNILDLLFQCLDRLETFLNSVIENNNDNGEVKDLEDKLKKVLVSSVSSPVEVEKSTNEVSIEFNEYEMAVLAEAKEQGHRLFELTIFVESSCILPAARAFMVTKSIEPHGELVKTVPDTEKLEEGEFESFFKLFYITTSDKDFIISTIMDISEIKKVECKDITDIEIVDNCLVHSDNEEITSNKEEIVEEVSVVMNETPVNEVEIHDNEPKGEGGEKQDKTDKKDKKANAASNKIPQTIRVSAERLDTLMNLVGELVINRTRVEQLAYDKQYGNLNSALSVVGSVTNDIQEIVMKLRMVPIENIFNRFPRLVRDISKDLGKNVTLKIDGHDTEMDRAVIDDLGDPLVHLVRNSLDHGLESPEERKKFGKPESGLLELSACNEGDNIIIKVKDDGKGLNTERIVQKAIEKGFITAEEAKMMTEAEKNELILLPGFSTHDVATDLSGRGVGMDVVKTRIVDLGGTVHIETARNIGTTITIKLPSTIVILQALLVKIINEVYAIPLSNINEVIDVSKDQIFTVQKKEVILLRGKTLPLVRMNKLLDVQSDKNNDEELTVVVAQSSDKVVGLVVSDLIGQKEVVIKAVNKKFCDATLFSGATTLGNGNVSLIINVNGII